MPGLDPLYLTVQGGWLGAAVGKGMADEMVTALRATSPADGPFAVFAYDYGRFMSTMQTMGGMGMGAEEQQIVQSLVQMFGLSATMFRFESHGLVARQRIQGR